MLRNSLRLLHHSPQMEIADLRLHTGLVKALRMLTPDLLAPLLKTIKNLTMLPSALEVLQNANAIEILVGILAEPCEGKLGAVRRSCLSSLSFARR